MIIRANLRKKIKKYIERHDKDLSDDYNKLATRALDGELGSLVPFARNVISGLKFPKDGELGWSIFKDLRKELPLLLHPEYVEYNYALSLLDAGEVSKGIKNLSELATKNYMPALTRMGTFHEGGKFGFHSDLVKAKAFYKKAFRLGHLHAHSLLAARLISSKNPIEKFTGVFLKTIYFIKSPYYAKLLMNGYNERTYF